MGVEEPTFGDSEGLDSGLEFDEPIMVDQNRIIIALIDDREGLSHTFLKFLKNTCFIGTHFYLSFLVTTAWREVKLSSSLDWSK